MNLYKVITTSETIVYIIAETFEDAARTYKINGNSFISEMKLISDNVLWQENISEHKQFIHD